MSNPHTDYTIETQEIPSQHLITLRITARSETLLGAIGEAIPRLLVHASIHDASLIGNPLTRYVSIGKVDIEVEAGVAVDTLLPEVGGIVNAELPGGLHATTVHVGPLEQRQAAHRAISEWIESHGYEMSGIPWETYLADPPGEADPNRCQTAIFYPISPSGSHLRDLP